MAADYGTKKFQSTTPDGAKHEKSKVRERQREETGEKGKQSLIGKFTYPVPPVARIVTICLAVVVVHLHSATLRQGKQVVELSVIC